MLVVVLNWNGYRHTQECLGNLRRQTYREHAVLVIDNGSSDGSPALLAPEVRPGEQLLALKKNVGFAGGMNIGLLKHTRVVRTAIVVKNDFAVITIHLGLLR